jgi:hypothetical protein
VAGEVEDLVVGPGAHHRRLAPGDVSVDRRPGPSPVQRRQDEVLAEVARSPPRQRFVGGADAEHEPELRRARDRGERDGDAVHPRFVDRQELGHHSPRRAPRSRRSATVPDGDRSIG